ncbi:MAG TPA: hypothetical protein ENF96_00365 [Archaeoglobus veneficus]|nr:hypothetical protein [Archaeoglobus veneficus]
MDQEQTSAASEKGLLGVESVKHEGLALSGRLRWFRDIVTEFVRGGVYLIAGEPGIGKSTLALQIALDLGSQGKKSVYLLTEQSAAELKNRAMLLLSEADLKTRERAMRNVEPEEWRYETSQLPAFLTHNVISSTGKYKGASLIVLDSIQGQGMPSAATKQYNHIYEFCRSAKAEGITTLLVGHVTKRGGIAGPKTLEHNVDCILYMRRALTYRPLFVPKNRFGPARFKPIPLEMDSGTTELKLSPHSETVSSVARSFLGKNYPNVETQAAVSLPRYGERGQITAPGLPKKEIEQLLSCISQLEDIDIEDLSFTIQCRLPGELTFRRILGLPLAMALLSSYLQKEIPPHHIYIGELDLQRRVRDVPDALVEELQEAIEAGLLQPPLRIFCPEMNAWIFREGLDAVTMVGCDRLEDAVYNTWPELKKR